LDTPKQSTGPVPGIVPGFKYDLFISYAHANNQYRWITEFQEDLSNLLWEQLPAKPTIWWDTEGLDGQAVHVGIKDAVYESAVFVPIVSIAYLNSGYCVPNELNPFKDFKHPVFPLVVGTCKRIVVVGYDTEADCPRNTWPEVLHDAPFASFCDTTDTGDRRLFSRLPVRDPRDEYWVRLGRIVRHLRAVLGEMRKGPQGDAVAELAAPAAPAPKAPAAWRARWKNAAVHVQYHGVDANKVMDVADRVARKQCDVTYLGNDADENLHEAYLKNSDAEILFFGCDAMDWARMDALRARSVASDQGRPKRIGVLTNGQCPQRFGMVSDFVVPLQLTDGGEIEGLDRLLEGLR
jgi:hypothetical protein